MRWIAASSEPLRVVSGVGREQESREAGPSPGERRLRYYHRRDPTTGEIHDSACCNNTAPEVLTAAPRPCPPGVVSVCVLPVTCCMQHRMVEKMIIDDLVSYPSRFPARFADPLRTRRRAHE